MDAEPQHRILPRSLHKEQVAERRQEEREKRPAQPLTPQQQVSQQMQPAETDPHLQLTVQVHSEEAKEQDTQQQQRQSLPQPASVTDAHAHPAELRATSSKLRAPQQYDRPDEIRQPQQPPVEEQPEQASDSHRQRQREHSQRVALQLQQQQDDLRAYQFRLVQRRTAAAQHMHLMAKPSPHLTPMLHQPMQSQLSSTRSVPLHHTLHPQLQPLMHMSPQAAFPHSRQPSHPLEHLSYNESGLLAPLTYSDLHRHEAQQQQLLQHSASADMLLPRVAAPAPLMHHSQSAAYLPSAWSASSDLHTLQLQAENDALIMQQQYRLQLAHQQEQQALEQQQQQAAAALQLQQQQAVMRQRLLAAQAVAANYPPVQLAPVTLPPPQPQPQPQPQPAAPAPQPPQQPAIGMDTMAQLTSLLLAQLLAAQANGGPSSLHHANLLAQGARLPPVSARASPQPTATAVKGKRKAQVSWNAAVAPLGSPSQQQANAIQLGGNPETRSLSADLVIAQTRQDAAMSKHVQRAAQRKLAEAAHAAVIAAEDAAAKAKRDADFNKRLMAQRRARARLDAGHERVKAAALTAEVAQMHSLGLIGDGSPTNPYKFPGPLNGQRSQAAALRIGAQEALAQPTREPQPYIDQPMHRTPAPRARARDRDRSPRTEPKPKQPPRLYAPTPASYASPPRKPYRQTDGPAHFMKFTGGGHGSGAKGILGVFSTYEADRSIPGRGQQMSWIQKWTAQQREQARKGRQGLSPLRALKADGGAASPPRFRDPSEFKPRAQQRSESVQPLPSLHRPEASNHRSPPRSRPRSHSPPRTQRSARGRRESPRRKEQMQSPPRSRARTPPLQAKQTPAAESVVAVAPVKHEARAPSQPIVAPAPTTAVLVPAAASPPTLAPATVPAPAPVSAAPLASTPAAPVVDPAAVVAPAPKPAHVAASALAPAPVVVVALPAPTIVVSPMAASPTPAPEPVSPVHPAPSTSASLQAARVEYERQLAVLEAAKQGALPQDLSSSRRSRSRTESTTVAQRSPTPGAEQSPVQAAAPVASTPAPPPPPPPSEPTPPPLAALRSSDELLTASTAHASMFPDSSLSGTGNSPVNRQLSTASSSSGSQGLTEFHKLIKQKSVAQRVVHEDGTDEIITTTTTVHRNSMAAALGHSRSISRTQSISLHNGGNNSSGSMPMLLDSLESAPYASVSRTRSLRIQAPPSPLAQPTPQLQSIPGTPPTPPTRSTHLSPMRHLLHQQHTPSSSSSTPSHQSLAINSNAATEYNVTGVSPHAAAAVADITEQAMLRRASSVLVPPADDEDSGEEDEAEVAARTHEKERSLLRRKQTYNFAIEDMPDEEELSSHSRSSSRSSSSERNGSTGAATTAATGIDASSHGKLWQAPLAPEARRKSALVKPQLWENPATNQTVSAVLKNAAMSDEDKQSFLASQRAPQRDVPGGKSNPLLRGIPATLRVSTVVAGVGSTAQPIVPQRASPPAMISASKSPVNVSSSRKPSRSPPNCSPAASAKPKSGARTDAASSASKRTTASKYAVAPQHPQPHHKEEEEKQQHPPAARALVAALSSKSPVAAVSSSTASISTSISDGSDWSVGDYADDAFVAVSARGTAAVTTAAALHPSPPLIAASSFDPARSCSSIESEARYSDDEYAEESVQEAIASPNSKSMDAVAAAHADLEQSVEEENFTL